MPTAGQQILDVTSYMVNAIWMRPDGLVRPFGRRRRAASCRSTAAIRRAIVPARTYDFGLNAGGGAFVVLNDVRRAPRRRAATSSRPPITPDLRRPDNFNYWRALVRR